MCKHVFYCVFTQVNRILPRVCFKARFHRKLGTLSTIRLPGWGLPCATVLMEIAHTKAKIRRISLPKLCVEFMARIYMLWPGFLASAEQPSPSRGRFGLAIALGLPYDNQFNKPAHGRLDRCGRWPLRREKVTWAIAEHTVMISLKTKILLVT